jgi:hypothetical protein
MTLGVTVGRRAGRRSSILVRSLRHWKSAQENKENCPDTRDAAVEFMVERNSKARTFGAVALQV